MAEKKSWRDYYKEHTAGGTADKKTDSDKKTSSWRDYLNPAEVVGKNVTDKVNSWIQNHNSYITDYKNRYSGRKYTYEDAYVSDSADWLNTATERRSALDNDANSILAYINQYGGYLDKDWVEQIKSTITGARGTQSQILDSITKDNEYWAKFTPNEEQKAAGYTAEKLYNEWQTGQKQYAEDQAYDVEAGLLELEGLKKERDAYLAEQEEKRKQAKEDESFWDKLGRWMGTTPDTTIPLAGANDPISSEKHTNEYDKRIAELEERIERAKYVQGYEGYMDYMAAEDFEAKSKYESKPNGRSRSAMAIMADVYHDDGESGWDDPLYEYINGVEEAGAYLSNKAAAGYGDSSIGRFIARTLEGDTEYLHMTEDEISVYNYLYKTQGKESANEYLNYIQNDLEGRKRAQEQAYWSNYAKESPVGSSVFSTVMAPLKGISYLGQAADMLDDGKMDENAGYNRFSYIPSTIRSQVSTTIENSGKWGKVGSFAYNTGMSMADFLFTTAVSGGNQALSLGIMGSGAAADATLAAKDRGLDDGQAFALGTIAGLAEVAMEKISLSAWLEGDMTEGALRYVLKNALSEGGEEAGTSMINLLADVMIAGDKSEWNMAMQAYIDQGKSPQEAFGLVAAEQAAQIGLDALGGILSGAAIGGGTYAGTSIGASFQYRDTAKNKESAQKLVTEGLELNPKSQYIQKAKTKLDKGKSLTGMQVRNILAANKEQITANDMKKIQKAAEQRFTSLGETGDVSKLAELATKWATGQDLNPIEKRTLTHSEYGSRVANELLPKNIASGDFSTEWAEEIGTKQVNAVAYNKKQITSILEQMASAEDPNAYKSLESRVDTETPAKVSDTGKAVIRATGEEIDLTTPTFKQITEDGVVLEANGKTVRSNEIDYDSEDQGLAISAIGKIEHITPAAASALYAKLDMTKPVMAQLNGMDEAFTYGYYNYSEADLEAGDFTGNLTKDQLKDAYNLGRYVRKNSEDAKTDAHKAMRTAAQAEAEKTAAQGKKTSKSKKMTITYNEGNGKIVDFDKAGVKLSAKQEGGVAVAKILHKLGLGTNFEFFTSKMSKDEDGNPVRVFVNDAGVEDVAYSGVYRAGDGTIRIDLNAYNGRGLTLNALAHELTHFVQQWSGAKYKVLADFLIKTYEKTDMTMHQRVLREQARLKRTRGKEVSYSEAYDEVVANAMSKMLDDGKLVERLTELKATDEKLARKLWEGFKKILAKFIGIYEKESALFHDAADLMEMKETFEQLQNMFAEALVEASENFQAAITAAEGQTIEATEQHSSHETDIDTDADSAYDSAKKETEQEDKANVRREETREDFHRRAVQEGCTVNDRGEFAYAFRPVADWNLGESIRSAERNLRKKGIQVIVCDLFEVNRDGITTKKKDAITAAGEAVYLHTAMETDPIETAEHEAYHFWKHTQARMAYFAELYKNFDFDSPAATDLLGKIEKAYIESKKANVETDVEVDSDESVKLIEEAFAYVTGFAASGDQLGIAHKILRDFDAVKAAWDDLVKKQADGELYSSQETDLDPNAHPYAYNTLIGKPDMVVTTVDSNVPKNRADVVYQAKQNAAKVGTFDPKTGSVSVYVDDVGSEVVLATNGLKHSLDRRFGVNAPVVLRAGEILHNSIRINEMTPKKEDASESYILIGTARNENGDMYIVRSVINRFSNELASMDVLYAINAKKEPAALLPRLTENSAIRTDSSGNRLRSMRPGFQGPVTDSTISIAELLDLVNQYFSDVLPEDVLKHYGYDARPEGDLGKDALYSGHETDADGYNPAGFKDYDIVSAVYTIRNEKAKRGHDLVKIGNMPTIYRKLFGLSGDVYVSNEHLYQNMVSKATAEAEGRFKADASADYHDLGEAKIINAIEQFQDPLVIMESLKDFKEPRLVAILDEKGNDGENLIAVLELYAPLRPHGVSQLRNHVLITIYEKNSLPGYIEETVDKDRILHKKEGSHLTSQAGLQLAGEMSKETLKKNVARFNKKVKAFKEENKINYSGHETDNLSNRDLLANAFEGITKSSPEYELIQEYKGRIRIINEYEEDLAKINAEIRKLTFGTEGRRDTQRLKQLQAEAKKLAERINRNDKKLLSLEASEPLRKVIERERKKEAQKTKDHVKEIQQNKKVRAEQTELRHKIRKAIRDLDKILNRGNKQRNVKEDLQLVVTKALQAAEILFTDNYGSYDMLRNGIGADMSDTEEALVKSCAKMLKDIDSIPNDGYDSWQARQEAENKLRTKMAKLKDVFARERKRLNNTTVSTILGELADAYASLEKAEQSYVQGAYSEAVHNFLKNLQSEVGGTIVNDMTKAQLESVYAAYKMVLTTVRKANQMFNEELKLTREQLGNAVIQEVLEAGGVHLLGTKLGDAISQADWNNMKPIWLANRIGSDTFSKLVNGLFKGQYNFAVDISEAKKFKLEMDEKYHPRSWDTEKLYEFESSTGKKFSLNLQQIMSLYAFSKRDQAYSHLLNGGFVFENNSTVIVEKNGIKRNYIHKGAASYKLNEATLNGIINSLTAEQKAYADEMQKYLSEVMGAKGNEVSMQLYGIKMFDEQFYFPLRSSGAYMERAKEAEMKKQQGQINLVNSGFTHAVKPEAKNPIVLSGFMDVWAEHCNEMSMYHSMVLPMEDFRKVYNYSTVHDEKMESASVFQTIQDAYGQAATNYIDQLYRELNASATIDPRETSFKARISNFKKAAVMLSGSVVVQQFSSIGRAYAVIDPKYFIGTKVNSGTQLSVVEEMKKYAPVAIIKEMGGFDTGTKGSAKAYIVSEKYGKGERIQALVKDEQYRGDIMGYLPAKADEKTWCAIWEAVKRETKANHSDVDVKSEEFLKLAGERFSEVIEKTQVYDSVLARSANMRSKSGLMQMATAFMAEPTTTVNLIEDAIRRGNKKYIARAFGAVAVSIVLNNALASIVYAMRDDDEDETFIEKYFQSFTSGMIDDINPMSYYPFLKDVYSLFQGYDVERADMSVIADVRDALKKVVGLLGKDTSSMDDDELAAHYKQVNEVLMGLLDAGCSMFGVPVKNVRRDAMGIINAWNTVGKDITERDTTWNSFWDKVGAAAKDTIPIYAWTKDKAKTDKLYDAIISGDKSYLARLKSTYKTDSAYETAVRKALRENDSRIQEAAQARYNGNAEEYKRIFREIQNEGRFSFDDIMSAINTELSKLEPDKVTSDYTATGYVEAIAMGNMSGAEAMKDDIIATKVANGKTQEEAEEEFASSVANGIQKAYSSGLLDEARAEEMLMEYAGKDEEEAASKVSYWSFLDEHPEYKDVFTESHVEKYHEFAEPADISVDVYAQFINGTKVLTNIKDELSDVEVTKREQVLEVIDSLPLTWEQKDALYLATGYAEDKIWDVPW